MAIPEKSFPESQLNKEILQDAMMIRRFQILEIASASAKYQIYIRYR